MATPKFVLRAVCLNPLIESAASHDIKVWQEMPCNKCRMPPPYGEDTWTLPCSRVESLSAGLKILLTIAFLLGGDAEDTAASAARQGKSIKRLSTGLATERASPKKRRHWPVLGVFVFHLCCAGLSRPVKVDTKEKRQVSRNY